MIARMPLMLSDRAQNLLKILVERYIADGQPVGSRALSRHSPLELSPATIRNMEGGACHLLSAERMDPAGAGE